MKEKVKFIIFFPILLALFLVFLIKENKFSSILSIYEKVQADAVFNTPVGGQGSEGGGQGAGN